MVKKTITLDSKKIVKEAKRCVHFAKERHMECVLVKKRKNICIFITYN